jgi:beta-glucuronidase
MKEFMLRTFRDHKVRETISLDGLWQFVTAADRSDRGLLPTNYSRPISVPSAWEMLPGLENYRGKAWLRTTFTSVSDRDVRLVFGGVSHTGTVYVDGEKVGSHYDAFTPWDVMVKGLEPGEHELVVEVDNTFGKHSALHLENDYMTYGGITRPVECQYVPSVHIDKLFATPVKRGRSWSLAVRVRLCNHGRVKRKRSVVLSVAGVTCDLGAVTVGAGKQAELSGMVSSLDVDPWTPDTPALYPVECLLKDGDHIVDDLIDRVGFRDIKVRGKKVLLNGQSIRLRGYNRHEDHPQFGNALPVEAMITDLEIMRDLGCNTIRTSHYPNDMRFLDLCDEMGFMVWEESHARTVDFDHPMFREQIKDSTVEMVEWHHNHPSIVMWGCLNECDSKTVEGKKAYEMVLKLFKKLDPSRPTTFASDKSMDDICLGLVDIVSWNIYTGWYGGGLSDIEPVIKQRLRWLHSDKSHGGKGKPVILSEFGGGAIYGCRRERGGHWTEEYQRDVLDETLRVYLNHPDIAGATIWQFCDVRVTDHWKPQARPRNMNNKGTVDEYRRPKLAYETVKRRMHEAILSKVLRRR